MKAYHFPRKDQRSMRKNKTQGFTLIEVLVVILIIVTLVGIVIGIVQLANTKTAEAQAISMLAQWKADLERYKEKKGDYPLDTDLKDADGLQLLLTELYPTADDKHSLQTRDPWGSEYRYLRVSKHRYKLGSLGVDRKVGDGENPADDSKYIFMGQGDDITIDNGRM